MTLLVDTGIMYAAMDRRDSWHARASKLLKSADLSLVVPVTTLPEVAYLAAKFLGSAVEGRWVEWLAERVELIEGLEARDVQRAAELLSHQPRLGFVDATIVAMAERLEVASIATTDRRHFSTVRPRHVERFTLLP